MKYILNRLIHHLKQPFPLKSWICDLIKTQPKIVLGRWNTDYCKTKVDTKVHWANEDHCGPCGNQPVKQVYKETPVEEKKANQTPTN
jgi:hypothetical protein